MTCVIKTKSVIKMKTKSGRVIKIKPSLGFKLDVEVFPKGHGPARLVFKLTDDQVVEFVDFLNTYDKDENMEEPKGVV